VKHVTGEACRAHVIGDYLPVERNPWTKWKQCLTCQVYELSFAAGLILCCASDFSLLSDPLSYQPSVPPGRDQPIHFAWDPGVFWDIGLPVLKLGQSHRGWATWSPYI